jgi:hypothetical protein
MTLIIQKPTGAKLVFAKEFSFDPDAAAYITAVEAADTQALETNTRYAINNFVIGCKQDGIWSAIKASCILAGARTLTGALVPLAGTAPTNFNFVSGDYNRKTGLVGDGSTKYLDSNRNNNADPQNSQHLAVHVSVLPTGVGARLAGFGTGTTGRTTIGYASMPGNANSRNRTNTLFQSAAGNLSQTRLVGVSRISSANYAFRYNGSTETVSGTSETPAAGNIEIFRGSADPTNARLAFYSIGESLDLALLDARVTDLINAFGAAIP